MRDQYKMPFKAQNKGKVNFVGLEFGIAEIKKGPSECFNVVQLKPGSAVEI